MNRLFTSGLCVGALFWVTLAAIGPSAVAVAQPLVPLKPTPKSPFTPTPANQKGYWNIDVVGDFYLPAGKSVTFNGAGRNLHVNQDWDKLFRRGFTALERTRMTDDEQYIPGFNTKPTGWKSRLVQSRRALAVARNYFYDPPGNPFNLAWARDAEYAPFTKFIRPKDDPYFRNSLGQAMYELDGGCKTFGDCPLTGEINTYGRVFLDIENEGVSANSQQHQTNLYVMMMQALRDSSSAATEIGSIGPVPHNSYGATRQSDYDATIDPFWNRKAAHTDADPNRTVYDQNGGFLGQGVPSSRDQGMPDRIVGKSFGELVDFQMPGTYYVYEHLAYTPPPTWTGTPEGWHSDELLGKHWLAALLGEQEVNLALSPKKRIAWQWLFNTQSDGPFSRNRADYPAPPAVAEGTAIFYWFTGADGVLFWDDVVDLFPNQNTPPANDPKKGLESDRNYTCYEHYLHGLWRLFNHHRDLFSGREKYLNQNTDCSFDGGATWHKYTARDLKVNNLPFARAIVSGNQILIAAHRPYATPDQQTAMMVRYQQDGYDFMTQINLTGDEVYLGRATMPKPVTLSLCQNCPK